MNDPIFMNPRMLAKPLQIAGVMMEEERPMIGLDFLDDFSLRQSSLVLDDSRWTAGVMVVAVSFFTCGLSSSSCFREGTDDRHGQRLAMAVNEAFWASQARYHRPNSLSRDPSPNASPFL